MKKGLIVLVAMFLPMSLFGSTELIYAWGYGSSLNEALQALKGLTSEADYIIKSALAIAVLVFSISKALDSKSSPVWEIGKLVLLYGIVYHFFLSPSNNTYVIHDEVSGNDYKVSKLPSGLGNTVSLMSRLEKVILDGMEKHYSTPNSIAYSQAGLGFSLSAMMDIPTLRITRKDALMQSNMNYYVKSCYSNNLGIRIHQNSVLNSSDLAQTILLEKDGKLVYWQQDDGNGGIKSSIISCGEAATMIKKGFLNVADLIQNETAIKNVIVADYLNKFQNVAQLYFGQAAGSREQFQQILVMNALDDGIINTAKMLGLNPQSFAANTAIADQTITTSMQSQGRLAQTYLPLAKAYMTIIIISVSWLMAIISIMFGSYTHIKMFFTLCLTMVLWTPILSIINFLNDLNIQHTFGVINQNDAAFTYSNYKEVIQKVTANSNFLNYLVMLTPMLAYALAKGSEMGFVSIASSLSQQLAGASRAASGFATQQALSTSTAITTPKGDEVYALQAGYATGASTFGANGRSFGSSVDMAMGNTKITDNQTGAFATFDGQNINSVKFANINANDAAQNVESKRHDLSRAIQNSNIGQKAIEVSSGQSNITSLSQTDTDTISKASQHALARAYSEVTGVDVTQSYEDAISGKAGASINLGKLTRGVINIGASGEVSTNTKELEAWKNNLTDEQKEQFNKTYNEDIANQIANNHSVSASFQNLSSSSEVTQSAAIRNSLSAYSEAVNLSNSVSTDGGASMIRNYINKNLGGVMNEENIATAMSSLDQMGANGNMSSVAQYAGVNTDTSHNLKEQHKSSFYNPLATKQDFNRNSDRIDTTETDKVVRDRNAPKDNTGSPTSGKVLKASDAAKKYYIKDLTEERDKAVSKRTDGHLG